MNISIQWDYRDQEGGISHHQGLEGEILPTKKQRKEVWGGDGAVVYSDCGGGCVNLCVHVLNIRETETVARCQSKIHKWGGWSYLKNNNSWVST